MKGPIKLTCPLCEKPVHRIEHKRDYTKKGLNATIWFHPPTPCFVVDDLFPDDTKEAKPGALFEIIPLTELKNARA